MDIYILGIKRDDDFVFGGLIDVVDSRLDLGCPGFWLLIVLKTCQLLAALLSRLLLN
jgi:hypothetical protein